MSWSDDGVEDKRGTEAGMGCTRREAGDKGGLRRGAEGGAIDAYQSFSCQWNSF